VAALEDLRSATAFTYVDTYYLSNCSVFISTLNPAVTPPVTTTFFTAVVDGKSFPAQNSLIIQEESWAYVFTTTEIYQSFTFTGLIVTTLTPGQSIQIVSYHCCSTESL